LPRRSQTDQVSGLPFVSGKRNRIPQAGEDIAGGSGDGEGSHRHEAANPADTDMVGHREGRVPHARREQFDKSGGHRAIERACGDHQHEEAADDERPVELRGLGLEFGRRGGGLDRRRVAGGFQRGAEAFVYTFCMGVERRLLESGAISGGRTSVSIVPDLNHGG
jgi:hypothetical protein